MRRKRKKKKTLMSRVYTLVMFLFLAGVSTKLYGLYTIYQDLEAQKTEIKRQLQEEKDNQVVLRQEKEYYKSDLYIEEVARERLGLVMPNEILFIDKNK